MRYIDIQNLLYSNKYNYSNSKIVQDMYHNERILGNYHKYAYALMLIWDHAIGDGMRW